MCFTTEKYSKTKIDKAGNILLKYYMSELDDIEKIISAEEIFDNYRGQHLAPLMKTTMQLQYWMNNSHKGYYIALRLKRKNQIIRKLKRLSVRLSQLQDIAGARIILENNTDVDETVHYVLDSIKNKQSDIKLIKITDYREKGRDDSGYRACHIILECDGYKIELQLRSRMQHDWAETIERTSVVYGYYLKELEGDKRILNYFKRLSNYIYDVETKGKASISQRLELQDTYFQALEIIRESDNYTVLNSHTDRNVLKALSESSTIKKKPLKNWILVFDWKTGNFITWDNAPENPVEAGASYAKYEKDFKDFEVVLVGASDASTIEKTHSHYFGIESHDGILKNIDNYDAGKKSLVSIEEQQILFVLYKRHCWNDKTIALSTLKNHFCYGVNNFDQSIDHLLKLGFITRNSPTSPVSLNVSHRKEIEKQLN